jgi:formylmethanofuran dehydrogenase subunit E
VRGDEKAWSTRCPDCPLVACDHCGNSVAVHDVLHGPVTGRPDHETCDRCGESVPADQTATLHQEHDRSYEKTLCSDCVSEVAVPPGYHLDRPSSR